MVLDEAVRTACEQPSLVDALSWIAVWECERAIRQAREFDRTGIKTAGNGGCWDTCFKTCFEQVIYHYSSENANG
jgi:hypothetical protein